MLYQLSYYEIITLLIAIIAVVISFISLYRTNKVSKQQLKLHQIEADLACLQYKELEVETLNKNKANINLFSIADSDEIIITNEGQGIAYQVNFKVNFEHEDHSFLIQSELKNLLPIPHIHPNQIIKMKISRHIGSASKGIFHFSWKNEQYELQEKDIFLSL